eukprot:gene5820-7244_t
MESALRRLEISSRHILENNNVSSKINENNNNNNNNIEHVRPFDPESLFRYLFPYNQEMRREIMNVLQNDQLLQKAPFGLSLSEERDLTFAQMKRLSEISKKYFKVTDLLDDPKKVAAWIQCYRFKNVSLTTLFGVHFTLFGASILFLGTDEQRERYLKHVEDLSMMGCFALTELGHGSNVQQIETMVEYDHSTQEFIVNSPTITSQKYFIGGAAKHARWTVLFAQLKVGGRMEGVHAFLVRIRDDNGNPCQGVKISDCGHKMALNGVDNGRLMFHNVRVPRDQLLSRYGGVNKAGIYSSPIDVPVKRFATNIGALVYGRYIIALGSVSFSSVSLVTAIRYAFSRRQFNGDDNTERQIISYVTHQTRLIPHLANTYALHFGNEYLINLFQQKNKNLEKEIHIYASALKAYGSWGTRDCIQDCREACGGQGFLSDNLIGPFKSETEIYTTFEGDNVLMFQQVSKFILTEARRKPPPDYIPPSDQQLSRVDSKFIRSFEFLQHAFTARLNQNISYVSNKLMEMVGNGKPAMEAWNDCGNIIKKLGIVFTEKAILDKFIDAVVRCPDYSQQYAMSLLVSLFALNIIDKDTWFLRYKYISPEQSEVINLEIVELCKELVPYTIVLTDALGFDYKYLGPIARDWVQSNEY